MLRRNRTRVIQVRMTQRDYNALRIGAGEAGLTLSDYIRKKVDAGNLYDKRPNVTKITNELGAISSKLKDMVAQDTIDKDELDLTLKNLDAVLSAAPIAMGLDSPSPRLPALSKAEKEEIKAKEKASRPPKKRGRPKDQKQMTVEDMLRIEARLYEILMTEVVEAEAERLRFLMRHS